MLFFGFISCLVVKKQKYSISITIILIVQSLKGIATQSSGIVDCDRPIQHVLSNLDAWNVHHFVSVFQSPGTKPTETVKNQHDFSSSLLSLSFYPLDIKIFMEKFYLNENNPLDKHVALVLPRSTDEAIELFNQVNDLSYLSSCTKIGMQEKIQNSTDILRPTVLIHWQKSCSPEECVSFDNMEHLFQSPPSVANDLYFLRCHFFSGNSSYWKLYGIYSIGRNNLLLIRNLTLDDIYDYYAVKYDFGGAELVSSYPDTVLIQELEYDEIEGKAIGGLGTNVFTYLANALNFTMRFVKTSFFVRLINDTWSTTAQQLIDGDTDVTIVKTTYLPDRKGPFTFLVPHYTDGIYAFFKQPPASSIRNIFAEPFKKNLWGVLIAVWFLVGFSTLLASKIKNMYDQRDETDEEISKDTLLWAIAFTCQQGWHQDPQSISMKMIFFCGSILGLIIYVAYSAALVSALSAAVVPIKYFNDLLDNRFYFTFEPGSQTMDYILNKGKGTSLDEIDNTDIDLMNQRLRRAISPEEGVGMVYASLTAYLSFSDAFYAIAKETYNQSDGQLCEKISSVRVSKVPFRSGMLMRKMSPYKEFFNIWLIQLYEAGLMRRYQHHYARSFHGYCDLQRHKKDISLEKEDMFTAYCIILSGYALSLTIFVLEWLHFKKLNPDSHQTQPDLGTTVDLY